MANYSRNVCDSSSSIPSGPSQLHSYFGSTRVFAASISSSPPSSMFDYSVSQRRQQPSNRLSQYDTHLDLNASRSSTRRHSVRTTNVPESRKAIDREIEYAHNVRIDDNYRPVAPHKSSYMPITPDFEPSWGIYRDLPTSLTSSPTESLTERWRHDPLNPSSLPSSPLYKAQSLHRATRHRALNQFDNELPSAPGDVGMEVENTSVSGSYSTRTMEKMCRHSDHHTQSHRSAVSYSSPSKGVHYQHHRRTQSSPLTSPARPQLVSGLERYRQPRVPTFLAPCRDLNAQFSPYMPQSPPYTSSHFCSSTLSEHNYFSPHALNFTLDEDAGGEPQEPDGDNLVLSPVRRRISFSTSAERDTPLAPDPVNKRQTGRVREQRADVERVGRELRRETDKVEENRIVKDFVTRAEDMLPTPPMSSPELELSQPTPMRSQPTRREPSIPVGSIAGNVTKPAISPTTDRKRKERPTLMDLLSSPQPSVFPERLSSSTASFTSTMPQHNTASPSEDDPLPGIARAEQNTVSIRSPAWTRKDDSLPPSSPFSSPMTSPVKSRGMSLSPSLPPASPSSPATERDVSPAENKCSTASEESRESGEGVQDISSSHMQQNPVDPIMEVSEQLLTPLTPGCATNPLDIAEQNSSLGKAQSMDIDPVPEGLPSQPQSQPSIQPPTRSPSASASVASPATLATHFKDDMKVEDEESDATMLDADTVVAPSSPLSEPPSPLPTKSNSFDTLSHTSIRSASSDSEYEEASMKKRKTGNGTVYAALRKKRKVDSRPTAGVAPHVAESRDGSNEERGSDDEDDAARDSSPPAQHVGRGRGRRGRSRASPVGGSQAASTRKTKPRGGNDEDDDAYPSGSVAIVTTKPPQATKQLHTKQAKRRATSPPSTSGSRSVSPAASSLEQSCSKESRARSKSDKPSTGHNLIDWNVLAPLPISELEGMIIETLATSRATSLSASALWEALLRSRPALKTTGRRTASHSSPDSDEAVDTSPLNKREWLQLLVYILAAGHLSSGLFGRVESSASDSDSRSKRKKCLLAASKNSSQPVTATILHDISRTKSAQRAQWFYIPEQDPDLDRASLVKSMMRGPGKRSETMKYKRYYWKPLGKISRWDREDDL